MLLAARAPLDVPHLGLKSAGIKAGNEEGVARSCCELCALALQCLPSFGPGFCYVVHAVSRESIYTLDLIADGRKPSQSKVQCLAAQISVAVVRCARRSAPLCAMGPLVTGLGGILRLVSIIQNRASYSRA
jgi:hypothetical protein